MLCVVNLNVHEVNIRGNFDVDVDVKINVKVNIKRVKIC